MDDKYLCHIYVDDELYGSGRLKLELVPKEQEKFCFQYAGEGLNRINVTVKKVTKLLNCAFVGDFAIFNIYTTTEEE